jgi:TolA-binding protein
MLAANSREERAYAAAAAAFHDAMWNRAETEFAAFVDKYPESARVPMAVLLQAQSVFKQGRFSDTRTLLAAHQVQATNLADQYINWTGEAQFAESNFLAAAGTFTMLANDFPNSSLRLSATVNAAAAHAQLMQWPQVEDLLETPDGVFQKALRSGVADEWVLRGQLLRAQAKSAQKNFPGAVAILQSNPLDVLPPGLSWSWGYLLCLGKQATGDLAGALATSTNLSQLAAQERDDGRAAASVTIRANLLEQMQATNEAIATYRINLANTNAPLENQQQAIFKIAELSAALGQFTNAEALLDGYPTNFPNSPAADVALLAVAELHLHNFVAQPAATNELPLAVACLNQFIGTFTNSQYLGQAYLDRGWCGWHARKFADSAADFKSAVAHLAHSPELAVAHFKLGDALFEQNDFKGALENYRIVVDDFSDFPVVVQTLDERVLYQSLRASLQLDDYTDATNAVLRIFKDYPEGNLTDNAILLLGEYVADSGQATAARKLFGQFARQFPHSELRPQAELAMARSYGQEGNWPAAITNYANWLQEFSSNELSPQVIYATAFANYQAGNETNALSQFTRFIEQFPTNDLAPQAQWWTAEYFFRNGDWGAAETNYENIYQNSAWKNSQLYYPAIMMAGRSAMGRQGYLDAANNYFIKLIIDTNCPSDLGVQARFACAAAFEQSPSSDTNNPFANYSMAINYLNQVVQMNPTNDATARAWGEIGKCNFQMSNFEAATNAYAQVVNAPNADVSARSEAQFGWGLALEKMTQAPGADVTNLLQLALNKYFDVFDTSVGKNLRDGEHADPFWVKKSGLQIVNLFVTLNERSLSLPDLNADSIAKLCDRLERLLPSTKDLIERSKVAALARLPAAKN